MDEKIRLTDSELEELVNSFKTEFSDVISFTKKYWETEWAKNPTYTSVTKEVKTGAGQK